MTDRERLAHLIKSKDKGLIMDLGCGQNKNLNAIGIDKVAFRGVDLVWDLEKTPYPLPAECATILIASHVVQQLKPWLFVGIMNEWWRLLKIEGELMISTPYAGSFGFYQDPENIKGFNEACVTPDTEVLTKEGYKKIVDIKKSDKVLSLNPDTNESEYVGDCRLVSYDHDGPMIHFSGRAIDLLTNENHRIWYSTRKKRKYEFAEAKEFLTKSPKTTTFDSSVLMTQSDTQDIIDIPSIVNNRSNRDISRFNVNDFAEFMGWYLSEGSVEITEGTPGYHRIHVAQSRDINKEKYDKIADVIRRLGFRPIGREHEIVFSAYSLSYYLKQFGHCRDKYIPRNLLNDIPINSQKKLLDSLILGDGQYVGKSQWGYTTMSRRLADNVQELALKCGYRSSISDRQRNDIGEVIYKVSGSPQRPIFAKEFKRIESYIGTVHSLIMPKNHIYLARRNGKTLWTGNTWAYFDPLENIYSHGELYKTYSCAPFKIVANYWNNLGNLEVVLRKRKDDPSYHSDNKIHYR